MYAVEKSILFTITLLVYPSMLPRQPTNHQSGVNLPDDRQAPK
jgi:hypothetical protein